jgi:hypothetical protein
MLSNIVISDHAIQRFRERVGFKEESNKNIRYRLRKFLTASSEVKLNKHYGVLAIINHGFRIARYYQFKQWILVVEDNELKTIHRGEAKRWVPAENKKCQK